MTRPQRLAVQLYGEPAEAKQANDHSRVAQKNFNTATCFPLATKMTGIPAQLATRASKKYHSRKYRAYAINRDVQQKQHPDFPHTATTHHSVHIPVRNTPSEFISNHP